MFLSPLGWACTVLLWSHAYRKWSGNVTCNAPSWLIPFQSISPQRPQHVHIFFVPDATGPLCFHALLSPLKARQSFVNRRPRKQPKPTCVFRLNCRRMLLSLLRQLLRVMSSCPVHVLVPSPFNLKWLVVWMSVLFASMTSQKGTSTVSILVRTNDYYGSNCAKVWL